MMVKVKTKSTAIEDLTELRAHFISKYGVEAVRFAGDNAIVPVDSVPTGVVGIDEAIGCGGIPRGRIIEIYGPESSGKTTTCLKIGAAFQNTLFDVKDDSGKVTGQRPGRVAFVDVEHAFDPTWASAIGLNVEELIFSQPSNGEQAYDIVELLVKSGKVELVIIDSIAAMITKDEIEGTLEGNNQIGANARMNSRAFAKINGPVSASKCTLLCVNQIREKIGVMFGCLHADTLIPFVDGRVLPIRQVYDEKVEGEVWSYNIETKEFEPKKIVDWHHNGDVEISDDYLHVSLRGTGTKNGTMQITVTPSHEVLCDNEFVQMDSLSVGDHLTTKQDCFVFDEDGHPNGTLGQFLTGVLSGDSHISKNKKRLGAALKIRDNIDTHYMNWKAEILSAAGLKMADYKCNSGVFYSSIEYPEFAEVKRDYPNRDPMILLDNFSWLGFAIWMMDDAVYERKRYQLSIKRFAGDGEKLDQISRALDELGLFHYMSRGGRVTFDVDISENIASKIACFVPECMDRKLPVCRRGFYKTLNLSRKRAFRSCGVEIVDIRPASKRQMKQKGKYDISVEGNHNYMAGGNQVGVVVHNSPETTPGGRALKFYSSIRMDIRRTGSFKVGDTIVGNTTKVTFKKNKIAPPFTVAEFNITFGLPEYPIYGVDPYSSLLTVAKDKKIVTVSGSHIKYDGESLGNGMAASAAILATDPNLFQRIYNHVITGTDSCPTTLPSTNEEQPSTSENPPQSDS